MRTFPLLLICASFACRGPSGDGPDAGNDGPTDDTGTTTTHDGFRPAYFGVTGVRFAVDDTGRASGFSGYSGGTWADEPISVEISIGDESVAASGFTDSNSCTVSIVADGPLTDGSWASGVDAWAAWELPDVATAFSNCDALDFPPAWGDPVDVVTSWTWGFGVGALDADVEASLRSSMGTDYDDIEPYIAGGGFYWDGLKDLDDEDLEAWKSGWVDTAVTFAYEVDEQLVQRVDGTAPIFIEGAAIRSGGSVARGLYDVQGTTLLSPASILLQD